MDALRVLLTFYLLIDINHGMTADPIYGRIGVLIKSRRKTLKFTQEVLAQQLGISRGALANIEAGRQNILVHQLYRFARVLEWTPFDLLPELQAVDSAPSRTDLPIPSNLNQVQHKQVAQFFSQIETNPTRNKEELSVK